MEELLKRLIDEAHLTPEQANQSLSIVIDFVKEKFPMLNGAIDQIFGNKE